MGENTPKLESRIFLPPTFSSFTALLEDETCPVALPHFIPSTQPYSHVETAHVIPTNPAFPSANISHLFTTPAATEFDENDSNADIDLNEDVMRQLTDQILSNEELFNAFVRNNISFEEMLQQVCHSAASANSSIAQLKQNEEQISRSSVSQIEKVGPGRKKGIRAQPNTRTRSGTVALPPDLCKLLGQAELNLAEGKTEEAKRICIHIMKQAPLAFEAYYTLSDIFWRQGDKERHRTFLRVASTLDLRDSEKLRQLLEIAERENDINDAVCICRKLISVQPQNRVIREKLISFFEKMNQETKALVARLRLYESIQFSEELATSQKVRELSKKFCELSSLSYAISSYEVIFSRYRSHATDLDENDTLDLMLHNKEYKRAIQFVAQYSDVKFTTAGDDEASDDNVAQPEWSSIITSCIFPPNKPSDIVARILIALIWEGFTSAAEEHIQYLLENCDLEVCGDLFFGMAEAFAGINQPTKAIELLEKLSVTENYSQELVWLLLGQCRAKLGQYEPAAVAYEQVIRLAPLNGDVVLQLVELHRNHGNPELAMDTLNQSVSDCGLDPRPALRYCSMLATQELWDDYVSAAWKLLFGVWCRLALPEGLWIKLQTRNDMHHFFNHIHLALRKETPAMNKLQHEYERTLQRCLVTKQHLWDVLYKLIQYLRANQRWHKLEATLAIAYCLDLFRCGEDWHKRLTAMFFFTVMKLQHYYIAYKIVSGVCLEMSHSNSAWNLFNITLTSRTRPRYDRFVHREAKKKRNNISVAILNAHNSLCSLSYRAAISAYVLLAEEMPHEALFPLCSAICWLSIANQKLVADRHPALAQGIGCLTKYCQLRGIHLSETNYNTGRFFQHVGLNHIAIPFYDKVINEPPQFFQNESDNQDIDVSKEAAFNLMLMYKKNGNKKMAAYVMQKYLVI